MKSEEGERILTAITLGWVALEADNIVEWLNSERGAYRGMQAVMAAQLPKQFRCPVVRKRLEEGLEFFRNVLRDDYRSLLGYIAENFEWGRCTEPDCSGIVEVKWDAEDVTMKVACPLCGKVYKTTGDFDEQQLRELRMG
ncbi:MAG: IBR domain-containing protein [Armatimonadetes bacterium]|nr:IBR domain-containing protein [Armatimonadota bacterium]